MVISFSAPSYAVLLDAAVDQYPFSTIANQLAASTHCCGRSTAKQRGGRLKYRAFRKRARDFLLA
jgi:hypothetical protein